MKLTLSILACIALLYSCQSPTDTTQSTSTEETQTVDTTPRTAAVKVYVEQNGGIKYYYRAYVNGSYTSGISYQQYSSTGVLIYHATLTEGDTFQYGQVCYNQNNGTISNVRICFDNVTVYECTDGVAEDSVNAHEVDSNYLRFSELTVKAYPESYLDD